MAQPPLKTCCFCQSLRNGSIISGILAILLSIITIIVIFTTRVAFKTIFFDWIPTNIVKIILVINLCMTILISLLMIVGVLKRNHYLMMPWVVLGIMIAIGLLVSVIYTAVVFFIDGFVLTGVLWLVFGLIACAILTYCWVVVYSQYCILSEESERGRYNKQPYRR
ncbi:uncharacterized protein LOC119683848 [Teleopsis dalmanni]|uniref:uncharacterized protein LOC119683848 n=1 Tax=Teleopsis dalmanni TaxID=139649 RepID=UPI0018CE75BB|nr:uncharacterized protein LOC119683848 [Teleopsis dalmanni]XP_037953643.1 uncharacterized protein LOC119683848 [Teleopsis dalmanni]XP_037953644.1 uncharacterized protein LOC119683848 [Teleopsis dalmanni]